MDLNKLSLICAFFGCLHIDWIFIKNYSKNM